MNPKLARMIAKGVASFIFSAVIGYTVKAGKKVDERIDAHFAEPEKTEQDN